MHNYRSRQVHETLNGVNPSSSFRDMRSAKTGPNLCQIWQVFGQWASLYGANGQMAMTGHNYRPRQFHRTSNGEIPSSGYRDMGSASLAAAQLPARPPYHPPAHPTTRLPTRPPGPWRQYPSSLEGWGVKSISRLPILIIFNLNICKCGLLSIVNIQNRTDFNVICTCLHLACWFRRGFALLLVDLATIW